jgi:putative membrane protein
MIVSIGISFIQIVLTYADFNISRSENGYHIHSGLINKKDKSVPFKKVQFISWKTNWLRQKLGLYLLQFHTIGDELTRNKMQVKVPVTQPGYIIRLLENYHPLLPVNEFTPLRISRSYIRRRVLIFGLIPVLILLPILFINYNINSLIVFLWLFLIWGGCWLYQKKFRMWGGEAAFQIKQGVFGKHEIILKWKMIQSTQIRQGLYQQKHNLATIDLNTASGTITIPFIDLISAQKIQNYALYKIESSSVSWI